MARTLVLQCDSGISGDMVVGALLDAGASEEGLRQALASLDLDGYEIKVTKKEAGALVGTDFDVVVDDAHENHDHDMEWLFGDLEGERERHAHHEERGKHKKGGKGKKKARRRQDSHAYAHAHAHVHAHDHEHEHDQNHHHDHHHDHGHDHHHDHVHRHLADIRAIIEGSALPEAAKACALSIFDVVAEAEAKAHGATPGSVHFHEVGAVDSIVDVAAVAWCLDDLAIDDVYVSELAEGEGHIRCAHGILPIPVPAVANIVEAHGLVLRRAHRAGELVTPTGAAIAAATATVASLPEMYRIVATGLGTGKRAYTPPSTLRVMILEDVTAVPILKDPPMWKLETEMDDCTGEALGYVLDRLYEAGAREAHYLPVFMKKGRPGYQVEILCAESTIPTIEQVLFEHTTTIGVRRQPIERTALAREAAVVETAFGQARVKRVVLPSGETRCYPEHDCVSKISRERDVPYQDVVRAVYQAIQDV